MGYDYSYYGTSSDLALVSSAVASTMIVTSIIALAISIVQIVAMWKLFTKAGQKGWKSIIPIYNVVILFKICGLSPWLILLYLTAIIPIVGWIVMIVLSAILAYKLALSFGKDGAWAVGIYFLAPIFYMILAFGKSQYVGPGGNNVAAQL